MNRHVRRAFAGAALAAAGQLLAACGGAAAQAPESPAPAGEMPMAPTAAYPAPAPYGMPGSTAPASPDEALAALERAEGELAQALGSPGTGYAEPPRPTTSPPPRGAEARPGADASAQSSGGPCVTACRALASMERSAQHLCDLAGPSDQRCEGARTRVKNATDRVHAQCPACADGG